MPLVLRSGRPDWAVDRPSGGRGRFPEESRKIIWLQPEVEVRLFYRMSSTVSSHFGARDCGEVFLFTILKLILHSIYRLSMVLD